MWCHHLPQRQKEKRPQQQQQMPFSYDFQPQADWTEDARNHVLRLQLPGFQKKDIRIQRENSGKVTVRGSRSHDLGTYARLDQSFPLPHDCDAGQIISKFEEGCLYLVIPKKEVMQLPPSQREAPPSSNKKQHIVTDAMTHDNAPSKKTQKRRIKEERFWIDG